MEKKFSRFINFSTREENILVLLVKKYKNDVECKKSDTNTNKIKAEAWVKICNEFNSKLGEPYRSEKSLKNKYENIKKRAKQRFADHKKYVTGTGGGPHKDIVITDTDTSLHDILGTQLTGLTSEFDSDATAETIILHLDNEGDDFSDDETKVEQATMKVTKLNVPVEKKSVKVSSDDESSHLNSNWAPCTATSMLKKPLSDPLGSHQLLEITDTPKKRSTAGLSAKLEDWTKKKSLFAYEKHQLDIQHMKEKHEQFMTHQQREFDLRVKFIEEEHDLKIKKLKAELDISNLNFDQLVSTFNK